VGRPGERYIWPEHASEDSMIANPMANIVSPWNGEHTVYIDYRVRFTPALPASGDPWA